MNVRRLRKDIKRMGNLILLLLLLSHLTACESSDLKAEKPQDVIEEIEAESKVMLDTYTSILEGIYYDHIFPDGQPCDWKESDDISQVQFSVYDLDKDGKEELVIVYASAYMASMVELIYDYDRERQTVNEVFREFPEVSHYENGIIMAKWSHSQGLSGALWPYNLYQYDSASDRYVMVGMVEAWDCSLSEINYNGDAFPVASDVDGDGIVYYIMQGDEYKQDHPVDLAEYEQWLI